MKTCERPDCNNEFEQTIFDHNGGGRRYCSNKCRMAAARERHDYTFRRQELRKQEKDGYLAAPVKTI